MYNVALFIIFGFVTVTSCMLAVWLLSRFKNRAAVILAMTFAPMVAISVYFICAVLSIWICGFHPINEGPVTDYQKACTALLWPGFLVFFVSSALFPLPFILLGFAIATPITASWIVWSRLFRRAHG